jgi:hypothetical protein
MFRVLGTILAILSPSAYVIPIARATSRMTALAPSVPKVMIWETFSAPYFFRTYSMTSSRRSSQKSMSMSGMLIRSGFRNRSNNRPYRNGSILVIARL